MNFGKLIWNYFVALLKQWYFIAVAILDSIGRLDIIQKSFQIPPWLSITALGSAFLIANFILYRNGQLELIRIKAENKKEIDRLNNRFLELEDRIPKLKLFFKHGDECIERLALTVGSRPTPPDFDKLIDEERTKLANAYTAYEPEIKKFSDDPKIKMEEVTKMMGGLMNTMMKSREDYNEECRDYLKEYRSYLVSQFNYDYGQNRYRTIQLAVKNVGRVICRTIVVKVHFPDEFHFFTVDDEKEMVLLENFMHPEDKPIPPKVTRSVNDLMSGLSNIGSYLSPNYPEINTDVGPRNVGGPYFRRSQSTEVDYDIKELLHNFTEDNLNELRFVVLDEAIGKIWKIPYEIHAEDLPVPIFGSLSIEVTQV